MMHKIMNGHAPSNLSELFDKQFGSTVYNLRSDNIQIPTVRTKSYKGSFAISGSIMWYSLPNSVENERDLSKFKKEIRKYNFCIDNINVYFYFSVHIVNIVKNKNP